MNIKYHFHLVICLLMVSCNSINLINPDSRDNPMSKIQKSGVSTDAAWFKTLSTSKDLVKNAWMQFTNNDFEYINRRFGVKLEMQDLEKLVFIPIPSYQLNPFNAPPFKTNEDIKKALVSDMNNAYYFVLKDGVLTFVMLMNYNNQKWKLREWSSANPQISKRFTEFFLKEKYPFLTIQIFDIHYCVYINKNGTLIDIQGDGSLDPFLNTVSTFKSN